MSKTNLVRLPKRERAPLASMGRRIGLACVLVLFVATVVRLSRDGYVDITDDSIGYLDAVYYASVTVTTTGYGDISAVSSSARLGTIFLITPARIMFLILVVSTTVEVLTEQSRELLNQRRWRQRVKNHTVICGFGATGQAAANDLLARGMKPEDIVVVDMSPLRIEAATHQGLVGIVGDATHSDILQQAAIEEASSIIVAPNRDDTAVLVTLTVREFNTKAYLIAGGREQENLHLLRQGGADKVIDATSAVGRMLGLGTHDPAAGRVLEDLMVAGEGLELVEIHPDMSEGGSIVPVGATLVAIVRNGERLSQSEVKAANIESNDRIVVMREAQRDTLG